MDPNNRQFETVVARRPIINDEDLQCEAHAIAEADQRDGTLEFIDALFEETMRDEPDYEW